MPAPEFLLFSSPSLADPCMIGRGPSMIGRGPSCLDWFYWDEPASEDIEILNPPSNRAGEWLPQPPRVGRLNLNLVHAGVIMQ